MRDVVTVTAIDVLFCAPDFVISRVCDIHLFQLFSIVICGTPASQLFAVHNNVIIVRNLRPLKWPVLLHFSLEV